MEQFEQRLLAEGLRAIEGDSPTLLVSENVQSVFSFEGQLLQRARALDPQLHISPLFQHFKGLTKTLFSVLAICVFILGASSVQQLFFVEQGTQINFFWAFALFFIPNIFALFLWLLLFFRPHLLNKGWLARVTLFLSKVLEKRFNSQTSQHPHFWSLFSCYFKVCFSGQVGRYQLSAVTHLLWFSYFCGATSMLILMLATHQVDFIWQTSILSLENFQWLTQSLAYVPDLLGFTVPDLEQLQQGNLAASHILADAQLSRFAWSSLLISSFFIYGLLPRFILWVIMLFVLKIKKKQFCVDLSLPYYVQLRQQLKPNVTTLGISDPDVLQRASMQPVNIEVSSATLPELFCPFAIELSDVQFATCSQHVKQHSREYAERLKNICDFQDQRWLLNQVEVLTKKAIVIYVSISRIPDRGLVRLFHSLLEFNNKSFYLVLIDDGFLDPMQTNKRCSDWYRLATQVGISLDKIVRLHAVKPNE